MPSNLLNLDALVPREDFEVKDDGASEWQKISTIGIRHLESNDFFYNWLRKPDFQRETANWSAEKVYDFVRTFIDGDLIPALILWRSGQNTFVIDGAHRLSALIAWVHDDYGDGKSSREFFQNLIPDEQQIAADKARKLIHKNIGTYQEHVQAVLHQDKSRPEVVARARRLATVAMQLQWVTGDAKKAEASFFKINQEATAIDKTELRILKSRTSPNALAARVIVRSATGHKYWSKFAKDAQEQIEQLGKDIYTNLFTPALKTPLKTLDIPIAGRGYSAQALPLIFELVNLSNDIKVVDVTKKKTVTGNSVAEDATGETTIEFLRNTRRLAWRISGLHQSSLGLHPAVYFYSAAGRYQPTSFLAMVSLVRELDRRKWFNTFTDFRSRFETFLLDNKEFPNQVTVKLGSGAKGFERLKNLYLFVIEQLVKGKADSEILAALRTDDRFSFVATADVSRRRKDRNFTKDTKSEVFLRDALANPMRCKICSGLIHLNSITVDHIERRQDGGMGVADNGQLAHPYCNSGYKEAAHAKTRTAPI